MFTEVSLQPVLLAFRLYLYSWDIRKPLQTKVIKIWCLMYVPMDCCNAGAKTDGVAQLLVFDLMKSHWEEKLPRSHAIELNVDIVMSSSPIPPCSETLLNLLKLEKVRKCFSIFLLFLS